MVASSRAAADHLDATLVDMRFVKPLDGELIERLAGEYDLLVTVEENVVHGGAGSAVNEYLAGAGISCGLLNLGIPDRFIGHDKPAAMLADCGLDESGIEASIKARLERMGISPARVIGLGNTSSSSPS
ncbi:MAG: transketolase C-terminal domain-containing protein [Gammaproteobacteria bacterium]|nr:transketolase C-terminal domain-containing protein [Gammaproteobacteria bacterium]